MRKINSIEEDKHQQKTKSLTQKTKNYRGNSRRSDVRSSNWYTQIHKIRIKCYEKVTVRYQERVL